MHVSILVLLAFVLGYLYHRWYVNYLSRKQARTPEYWIMLFVFFILLISLMAVTDLSYFYR